MSKNEHIGRFSGSISLTQGGEIVGEMEEHGRKVFSHAGSDTYPCLPKPKNRLVSGSEELEKLARAAWGRSVRLPAFPRSACLWGLPSEQDSLRLHLNKKLEPEAVGKRVGWFGGRWEVSPCFALVFFGGLITCKFLLRHGCCS